MKRPATDVATKTRATRKPKASKPKMQSPTNADVTLIPGLPQDVVTENILTWGGFLGLKDLKTLSMASRGLYTTMNDAYWRRIAEDKMFEPMYSVKAFAKLKPASRVSRIILKRICNHCHEIQMRDIHPVRPNEECFQVCSRCAELPAYAEIKYTDAIQQFKLKRVHLDTIPSRKKIVYQGYIRLFKLCDVLRLADKVKSQEA
ncbi:Aste57867_8620 [Aphanomyces stellatus]|uniref:Aste57867_8620 protein n=1 Tax=Aphanomyces stellatus TaxID=120398 RepID=A0A485KKS9_9STRA|nr:hypothetical protein As57867_008586 [Aphanomyces stellatus]VFT85506.1 Aste57867_8620 [Aphanomyces stellatus]